MRRRFEAAIESLIPSSVTDPELRSRARFVIFSWVVSIPALLGAVTAFAADAMWSQAGINAFSMVFGMLILVLLRTRGRVRMATHLTLAAGAFQLATGVLVTTPANTAQVAILAIVPLFAAFTLGRPAAIAWSIVALVSGVSVLSLAEAGYSLPYPNPQLFASSIACFVFLVLFLVFYSGLYVHERQKTIEQLRAAERSRATFLANVSHEIRTPMNGVLGMTEVLLQGSLCAEQREQLDTIRRSGELLVSLINDVLDSTKVEAGALRVSPVRFELNKVLLDLERLYAPLAAAEHLELSVSRADNEVMVFGDALRLRQILGNLITNAIKFAGGGRVTVTLERHDDVIEFAVTDTGPGISSELRGRLFQPFQQGDASPTRKASGSGLGLSLSRQLALLMGGSLELDTAYVAGARFVVRLPLPRQPVPAARPTPTTPVPRALVSGGLKVLVVDDNPVNLAVAKALVSRAGFEVTTAVDGVTAVAAAASGHWAAILMDVMMPGMDGITATRAIRKLEGRAAHVPIVALTACAMPSELEECRSAGMNDVLTKPLSFDALVDVLDANASAS